MALPVAPLPVAVGRQHVLRPELLVLKREATRRRVPFELVELGELARRRIWRRPAEVPPRTDLRRLHVRVRVDVAPQNGRRERVGENPLVPQPLHVWFAAARVAQRPILHEEAQPSDHVPQN